MLTERNDPHAVTPIDADGDQFRLLAERFLAVRRRSVALIEPLSPEDCCVQSMPDASPAKWHLAHTAWFFETFVLARALPDAKPFHPDFGYLFNSYYNGIGERHARPLRGLITRPALADVLAYRAHVDERIMALLSGLAGADRPVFGAECDRLVELGLQHEEQHQELLLTDIKHLLSLNPTAPAYRPGPLPSAGRAAPLAWHAFDGGVVTVGCGNGRFHFDNEAPCHRQFLEPYRIASRLVTNGEYLEFIRAGGYRQPSNWLSEGWAWIGGNGISHPFYWMPQDGGEWAEFTLYGKQSLDPHRPVVHLSYYEADAYARWVGARLPSEAEWEHATTCMSDDHVPLLHPDAALERKDWFGAAWQWTASSYAPYPGFEAARGAIGEYNGKFMVNQYVLRGASCVTAEGHSRTTYRNFFPASAQWQFSGIRLAVSGTGRRDKD